MPELLKANCLLQGSWDKSDQEQPPHLSAVHSKYSFPTDLLSRFADFTSPAVCWQPGKPQWPLPGTPGQGWGARSSDRPPSGESERLPLPPRSRSGCAGLAGVNISSKTTTAYFSQVWLQTLLVEQTWGSFWGWCLFSRCCLLWVRRPCSKYHPKLVRS